MPSLDEDIQRGEEARRLLDADAHKRAVAQMRETLVRKLVECPIQDEKAITQYKQLLILHDLYICQLELAVKNGFVAEKNLEAQKTAAERFKSLF